MKQLFVFCFFLLLLSGCSVVEVEKFGIFENEFSNNSQYENPYVDVDLIAEFQSPDGNIFQHFGFFDGNATWKIRFMPTEIGTWKYTASFSDGTNAGSGSFKCVKSEIKGPLANYEKNPIWFGTQNGEPFLMRSFHVGDRFFAENWMVTDSSEIHPRIEILNWAEEMRYNTLSVASFFTNRQSEGRGLGWDTPDMWPLDFKEYQKAEKILNELAEREFYIFPFAGFFGRNGDWPTDHTKQEQYIKYILARWGAYYNLLFNVSGPEPLLSGRPEHKAGYKNQMEIQDLDRLARIIKKYDVHNHLITVHNQTSASKNGDPFIDFEWCGFSTIQGPKTKNLKHHQNTVFKVRHPEKPYFAQETLWGGNKYHPEYGLEYIRKIGIVLTMNAAMINFADNNGNSSSGFSGSLSFRDCKQDEHNVLKNAIDFFETIPITEMKPDTSIVPAKFVLANENLILIYTDKPDSFQINLNTINNYRGEWINAQNADEIIAVGTEQVNWHFKTPAHGDDWFLKLTLVAN